ncbi:MAG: hypothetical protein QOH37_637 [Nocardioidaceae bacterium]|nr:hypothetical protein [Nocardioidaceae bacterium]
MITGRRSQEFHELVEGSTTRASSYAGLLELVGDLRTIPEPVADPVFVAALREILIAEAETVLAAAAADRAGVDERLRLAPVAPRVRRRNRRLAAAVSGVVLVGGSATMAVASQSALPGDGLYPIKRGIESAHAGLTFDRAGRGEVLLASASTRLDEAATLSRADAQPSRVDDALAAFTQQAVTGSDLLVQDYQTSGNESSMTALRSFTASSMTRLHDLQPLVPTESLPQLLQAAQALDQIQSVSVHTCPACSGPLATTVPTVLADATQVATGAWSTGGTDGGQTGQHQHHGGPGTGPSTGPQLPQVGGSLPPGSVTAPPPTGTNTDVVTDHDVQHTLHDLTGGLTDGTQNTLGSTVTDTTGNVLDAVGQVGNTVTGAVNGTLGGAESALPSAVTSNLPTLPSLP